MMRSALLFVYTHTERMPPSTCSGSGDATPAEANRALVDSAGALTGEEVEYFASICDRTDDDAAVREMPDADGWTAEERAEVIEGWRRGRRWTARYGMRPSETADEWRERCVAQMVAEHGCAPRSGSSIAEERLGQRGATSGRRFLNAPTTCVLSPARRPAVAEPPEGGERSR